MSLEEQILEVVDNLQTMILAKKYLKSIDGKIKEQEEVIEILGNRMKEELEDVQNLEGKSRKFLFNKILGIGPDQLELEKQEYLHSVLMYKDAIEILKPLEFEKKILEESANKIEGQQELLERMIIQRDKELIKLGRIKSSKLINIYRELDSLVKDRREIFEAKNIGLKCKRKVEDVLIIFDKASEVRDWGQLATGEADYVTEKNLVDRAVSNFHELKVDLLKFEEELEDVHEQTQMTLLSNTIKFDSYLESYNNYLINDWVVRKKLSSIISLIEALSDDIFRLLKTLDHKQKLNESKIQQNEVNKLKVLNNP